MSKQYILEQYYNEPEGHNWFSNCCGAKYYKTMGPKGIEKVMAYRGIVVALGDRLPEVSDDNTEVTHVKTKNGTITVKVRHAW